MSILDINELIHLIGDVLLNCCHLNVKGSEQLVKNVKLKFYAFINYMKAVSIYCSKCVSSIDVSKSFKLFQITSCLSNISRRHQ